MKILLYTDVHFAQCSSIVRGRGERYSERLENCVASVDWAERLAESEGCDEVFCLGDFFDKPTLNAEELTALKDIKWAAMPHTFIVGNHESNVSSLEFSSTNSLAANGFAIADKPSWRAIGKTLIVFVPYALEGDRVDLKAFVGKATAEAGGGIKAVAVFSHNDIEGIQYGGFMSVEGYKLSDIEGCCDLFVNGHLHNGAFLNEGKTILNLGNLTGLNFSEDASVYKHQAAILDLGDSTEGQWVDFLSFKENPFAYNFYKLEIASEKDFAKLDGLKDHSIVTARVESSLVDAFKEKVKAAKSVEDYRLMIYRAEDGAESASEAQIEALGSVDYLGQFRKFALDRLGSSDKVKKELDIVAGEGK